jgi:hypothetical protein
MRNWDPTGRYLHASHTDLMSTGKIFKRPLWFYKGHRRPHHSSNG